MADISAIDVSTRRFMKHEKKGHHKGAGKGFMGGGKDSGFVTTPMNAPKKGFKGGK